jgi:hypothetical protein
MGGPEASFGRTQDRYFSPSPLWTSAEMTETPAMACREKRIFPRQHTDSVCIICGSRSRRFPERCAGKGVHMRLQALANGSFLARSFASPSGGFTFRAITQHSMVTLTRMSSRPALSCRSAITRKTTRRGLLAATYLHRKALLIQESLNG